MIFAWDPSPLVITNNQMTYYYVLKLEQWTNSKVIDTSNEVTDSSRDRACEPWLAVCKIWIETAWLAAAAKALIRLVWYHAIAAGYVLFLGKPNNEKTIPLQHLDGGLSNWKKHVQNMIMANQISALVCATLCFRGVSESSTSRRGAKVHMAVKSLVT
jgi:hypothetical protein